MSSINLAFCFPSIMVDAETDNTIHLLESPKAASSQPPSIGPDEALEDILTQPWRDVIHAFAASMRQGVMQEASKTEEFTQGISAYMLVSVDRTTQTALQGSKNDCFGRSLTRMCGRWRGSRVKRRAQKRGSPRVCKVCCLQKGTKAGHLFPLVRSWVVIFCWLERSSDVTRQDRLRVRLSELMAAVSKAVEMFVG